jgi:hypothetical protein
MAGQVNSARFPSFPCSTPAEVHIGEQKNRGAVLPEHVPPWKLFLEEAGAALWRHPRGKAGGGNKEEDGKSERDVTCRGKTMGVVAPL